MSGGDAFGHPAFDLAVARSRMLGNARREARRMGIDERGAEQVARGIWGGMLEGYFEGTDAGDIAEIGRRIEALSEVEACCLRYHAGSAGPEGPGARQRVRVAACAGRLSELLPRIGRLDF